PITRSVAEYTRRSGLEDADDDQLENEVLLCIGQRVMLLCNLCVEVGLVNGSIGTIQDIIYTAGSKPPSLPMSVIVRFDNYTGPAWDTINPKSIPILP
ncbi:hypothetical protein KI387_025302, partial [Taxus chinensis]